MNQINLSPRDVEAILAVATHCNFHAAAAALGMSQPAISSRVRHAEDVLGVKLFHRTTRKVTITEHGERLRIRAEQVMAELRAVAHEFQDEAQLRRGRVIVGVAPTVAAGSMFLPIVERFNQKWPLVEVIVKDDLMGRSLDRLISGEIDFSVGPAIRSDDRFRFEPLAKEELVVVAPKNHPLMRKGTVRLADVARYPLLTMPMQSAIWETLNDAYQAEGLAFKPAFVSHNVLTFLAMAKAGFGLCFLPVGVIPLFNMDTLKMARIVPRPLLRAIAIGTARGRAVQPGPMALMKALRSEFNSPAKRVGAGVTGSQNAGR